VQLAHPARQGVGPARPPGICRAQQEARAKFSLFVAKGPCATKFMALYAAGYYLSGGLKSLQRTEARGASANSMRSARASISWQSGLLLQRLLSQPPFQKRLRDHRPHNNPFGPPAFSALGASLRSNGLWPSEQAKVKQSKAKKQKIALPWAATV
jgi:hypothetical protein